MRATPIKTILGDSCGKQGAVDAVKLTGQRGTEPVTRKRRPVTVG